MEESKSGIATDPEVWEKLDSLFEYCSNLEDAVKDLEHWRYHGPFSSDRFGEDQS